VVIGNPPYITVKDSVEKRNYKKAYQSCSGNYQLTVPFVERFFQLARRENASEGAGYIGQIASNGFIKREFGKQLIEQYLQTVTLTHVIDTSGAYIPGHGTPTIILFGRRTWPNKANPVRAVLGKQGESGRPDDPAQGDVWRAIVEQISCPGTESQWVTVSDLSRDSLSQHPWSLSGGGAGELIEALHKASRRSLLSRVKLIGRTAHTGADDAYHAPRSTWVRYGLSETSVVPLVEGEAIRDWHIAAGKETVFPYGEGLEASLEDPGVRRLLWPNRSILRIRREPGGTHEEIGLTWYEWSRWHPERFAMPMGIAFAFVATHNHFVLDRGGKVFKQSAPVIKLPEGASEDEHLELLGVLNSSTACFWLKQVCHGKGNGGVNEGYRGDE